MPAAVRSLAESLAVPARLARTARLATASVRFGRFLLRPRLLARIDRVLLVRNCSPRQDFGAETVDIRTDGSDYLSSWSFPVARIPRSIV